MPKPAAADSTDGELVWEDPPRPARGGPRLADTRRLGPHLHLPQAEQRQHDPRRPLRRLRPRQRRHMTTHPELVAAMHDTAHVLDLHGYPACADTARTAANLIEQLDHDLEQLRRENGRLREQLRQAHQPTGTRPVRLADAPPASKRRKRCSSGIAHVVAGGAQRRRRGAT